MVTEKQTLKSTLVYSDDKRKRYRLDIEWDKSKKTACVIMLASGNTSGVFFDKTTSNVVRNLCNLDFGSVRIVNLFAEVCDGKAKLASGDDAENLSAIGRCADGADAVIFAVGTGKKSSSLFQDRQKAVLQLLNEHKEKCFCISDNMGNLFYHPLCPKVYDWVLQPLSFEDL